MLVISDLNQVSLPTAIALGNFDGLHQGHRRVIEPVLTGSPELIATVATFSPHPKEFFSGIPQLLLTPIAEKIQLLAQMGVQQLILLPFDDQLAQLNAQEFMQTILLEKLQAQRISVGFDFHFGCQRCGSVADLQQVWRDRVHIVPAQLVAMTNDNPPVRISSSIIRTALAQGEIELANTLLGRPYHLIGNVVTGKQMGRKLGFPTANLKLHPQKFLPRDGVYAVRAAIAGSNQAAIAVMNIGVRPTVDPTQAKRTVEVHLLNWSGDLYGQELQVELLKFLRPEQRFDSLDQLKQQIAVDCAEALSNHTFPLSSGK